VAIVVPDGATLTNQVLLYLNGSPVSGVPITVNPTGNLSVSKPYAIRISGNAVKDLAAIFSPASTMIRIGISPPAPTRIPRGSTSSSSAMTT
jgi:hypothetical protein